MVVYRRETRHRSVLLLVVITSLILVTLDSRGNGVIDSFRSVARDTFGPIQQGVEDVFRPVRDLFGGVTDYSALKDENAQLKRKIANLEGKLAKNRAVGSDVTELQQLLDLPTIEDATGIAARVVGTASGNFDRTVEINKGTDKGVFAGEPVVAGNGLVGKVTEASGTLATVTLVDAPGLGVGVRLENTKVEGLTEAHVGERQILLKFLGNGPNGRPLRECKKDAPPDTCISINELVFTAAVANAAFPPDIPVARVVSVVSPRTELEATITLQPLVNLDDLTYVKVLRWPEPKPKAQGR
jgi:rod shape-determining protein MreC